MSYYQSCMSGCERDMYPGMFSGAVSGGAYCGIAGCVSEVRQQSQKPPETCTYTSEMKEVKKSSD